MMWVCYVGHRTRQARCPCECAAAAGEETTKRTGLDVVVRDLKSPIKPLGLNSLSGDEERISCVMQ